MTRAATERWYGWHLSTGVLSHGDGRPIVAGETHTINGPLVICQRGLHASAKPLDAVGYATGTVMAYVELIGERVDHDDKSAALTRRYLAVADVGPVLHEFACNCAEVALMLADVEDERCWRAIHVKREWVAGRATDADLAAAGDAAGAAARAAAWAAARYEAWDEANDLLTDLLREALGV